jgi:hypothetical protein
MDDHRPEDEARMRLNLGLSTGPKAPAAGDPQRLARQAIRAQVAAREYAERHVLRAEQTIRDLLTKLHDVRREKDAAVEAGRAAHTALGQADRAVRNLEAALIQEKAASSRAQQEAQAARASLQDMTAQLALASQTVEALQTQMAQQRQAHAAAEAMPVSAPAVSATAPAPEAEPVKRTRGRPPGKHEPAMPPRPARKPAADSQRPVKWWKDGWTPTV